MSDTKLGILAPDGAQRDAIHIAVAPVTSDERLYPGQSVSLVEGRTDKVRNAAPFVGIVDPFLTAPVQPGDRFWLLLYPQTITSLRHEWTHPAFAAASLPVVDESREESRKWLDEFAHRLFSYPPDDGTRLEHLLACAESGCFGTDIEYRDDCKPDDEFWAHYERYTGRKIIDPPRSFRCAC